MARDEFSKQTQDTLAKRVGVRCSSPSCGKFTVGPRTKLHHIVNIEVAAHITAASNGGPQFTAHRYGRAIERLGLRHTVAPAHSPNYSPFI